MNSCITQINLTKGLICPKADTNIKSCKNGYRHKPDTREFNSLPNYSSCTAQKAFLNVNFCGNKNIELPVKLINSFLFKESLPKIKGATKLEDKLDLCQKTIEKFDKLHKFWTELNVNKILPVKIDEKYGYRPLSKSEILTEDEKTMLGKDLSHEIVNHYYEIENYIYSLRTKTENKSEYLGLEFDKYCKEKFLAIVKTYQRYQFFFDKGLGDQNKNISDVFGLVKNDLVKRAARKDLKVTVLDSTKNPNIKPVISNYKLYTIFYNLFNNAIKYTPANGNININLSLFKQPSKNEPFLFFAVSDNGIGIPEKEIKKVVMGKRGSNTSGIKGTGHGLNRIKKILDNAGGDMKIVSSTAYNRSGTQIICKIPVKKINKSRKSMGHNILQDK